MLDARQVAQGTDGPKRRRRRARADGRALARTRQQLADVVVRDEAVRVRPGDDDAPHAFVGLHPLDQRLQALDRPRVHQAVRWVVERREEHPAPRLDPNLAHGRAMLRVTRASRAPRPADRPQASRIRRNHETGSHRRLSVTLVSVSRLSKVYWR